MCVKHVRKALCCLGLSLAAAIGVDGDTVTGTVVTREGVGVADATVLVMPDSVVVTTGDDGNFAFAPAVSVTASIGEQTGGSPSIQRTHGAVVVDNLPAGREVSVRILNLNGQTLARLAGRSSSEGRAQIRVPGKKLARIGQQVTVISVAAGDREFLARGNLALGARSLISREGAASGGGRSLAKHTAKTRTLIARKDGYLSGRLEKVSIPAEVEITLFSPPGKKPIAGGAFRMGSIFGKSVERPEHDVELNYDFLMDSTEVTQGQYAELMGVNPWEEGYELGYGDSYPAYHMSWYDAALFCNALSKRDGLDTVYAYSAVRGTPGSGCHLLGLDADLSLRGYRLPTEAEWEYACRAGSDDTYYWGSEKTTSVVKQYAWYRMNADSSDWTVPHADQQGAQPAATRKPNAFGLYDMSGNVWEMCNDLFRGDAYKTAEGINPCGPVHDATQRVQRGGSWYNSKGGLTSSYRIAGHPDSTYDLVGFRTVVTADPVTDWRYDSSESSLPRAGKFSGSPVSFTVSSSGTSITSLKCGPLSFSGGYCSRSTTTVYMYRISITGKSFYKYSPSDGLTVRGTFDSPTSASGTYTYSKYSKNCGTTFRRSGSWTASAGLAKPAVSSGSTRPEEGNRYREGS